MWTQPEAAALNVHGLTGVAQADGQQTANVQPETSKAVISRGRQLFPGTASQALLPSAPQRYRYHKFRFALPRRRCDVQPLLSRGRGPWLGIISSITFLSLHVHNNDLHV